MGFAVAGQLAFDPAEEFQILERHAVKTVIRPERIDAVLRVAGVVDEIVGLVPGTVLDGKKEPVNRRHDFSEGGGPSPVACGAAVDGVDVHQRDQCAGGPRVS